MTLRNYFRLLAEDRPYRHQWTWFWKPLLKVASWFYGFGIGFRAFLFQVGILKKQTFSHPVVSIGNLTWGGTGKTPLVEYVARFFINRANVPLILARGYGEDESKMFLRQLQGAEFGIGKNRYETGRRILATRKVDVVILDDGFQHWNIKRDLDIVAVNVLNPFGNLSLLPYGILREPLASLKRASIVILTDVNLTPRKELEALKSRIRAVVPKIDFVEAHREALYGYRPGSRERISVDRLQGKRVTSFSGIGTPRSFQMLLNQLGMKTIRNFEFCDHHRFTDKELREILHAKETSESEEIITTEKDFFRSEGLIKRIIRPIVLKVRLRLTDGETLLHQYLARFATSRPMESHMVRRHQRFQRRDHPRSTPSQHRGVGTNTSAPQSGQRQEGQISPAPGEEAKKLVEERISKDNQNA